VEDWLEENSENKPGAPILPAQILRALASNRFLVSCACNIYVLCVPLDKRRWMDNIKMNLREMGWDGMDWIDLAQDRVSGVLL
jgi:hypothetical protein